MFKQEWKSMIERGTMPLFEIEIINDEYLLVNLECTNEGIEFSFCSNDKPVSFDGVIVCYENNNNRYLL